MNKQMKKVSCVLLVVVMFFAQCSYAAGEEAIETKPPVLLRINEDLLDVWAEMLGFSEPLKRLPPIKSWDDKKSSRLISRQIAGSFICGCEQCGSFRLIIRV